MTVPDVARRSDELSSLILRKLLLGDTYTVSEAKDAGASGTVNLRIQNPVSSGKLLLLYLAEASHEDEVEVVLYDAISEVSGGSEANVSNNHIGIGKATAATIEVDVTFTGDEIHQEQVYVGSGTEQVLNGYKIVLHEGEEVLLEITDQSGGADEMGARIAYAEL